MKKTPSICIFTSLYPPAFSGSAIHCVDLARNLARRGCCVAIITSKLEQKSPDHEIAEGVDIFRIHAWKLPKLPIALNFPWLNLSFSPANLKRVVNILRELKPDVIHLHNHMFDSAFLAVRAAKQLKIPLVLTVHTIIKHTNPAYDKLLHLADRFILKHFVVQHAEAVICQDEIVADYVRSTFNHGNIQLIPYGISTQREPDRQKTEALRKKYEVEDGPIILSLGHVHDTRNRRELIEILPRLIKVFPALRVFIVGYVGTNSTAKLVKELGLEDYVTFTGTVPHGDVPEFLALADIEAHWFDAKHPHKTPGIAGQEVMSAGKVMVSNAGENVYGEGVLKNGDNVILTDPGDPEALFAIMANILGDSYARKKMQGRASETAKKHFNWDVIYSRIIEVYESAQKA